MIDLYYWPTPNGHKITMFLEEAALPYTISPVNIGAGDQFKPDFLKIAPNNRMPAIVDHAPAEGGAAISVFESGAILTYLAEKTGRFLPEDVRGRFRVLEWLFWQMGGLGPMAGQNHHFTAYAPEKIDYAIKRYVNETNRLYGVLDRQLAQGPFIAGDYSIADMASYPWIVPYERQGQNLDDFPHLKRWFEAVRDRPATIAAYKKGEAVNRPKEMSEEEKRMLFGPDRIVSHQGPLSRPNKDRHMGKMIVLKASDGVSIGAYRAEPAGRPRGGLVVLQEIFGVNAHIRAVADGFADQGYLAIAPALFDRVRPGMELGYDDEGMKAGTSTQKQTVPEDTLKDVQAAIAEAAEAGPVGVVGYCWGGTLAYVAAARLSGVAAAVGYYGGGIASQIDHLPKVPVLLHFGEKDAHIPLTDVEKIRTALQGVPVYTYPAGHGFNCDHRGSFDKPSADLALGRTLDFLRAHVG